MLVRVDRRLVAKQPVMNAEREDEHIGELE